MATNQEARKDRPRSWRPGRDVVKEKPKGKMRTWRLKGGGSFTDHKTGNVFYEGDKFESPLDMDKLFPNKWDDVTKGRKPVDAEPPDVDELEDDDEIVDEETESEEEETEQSSEGEGEEGEETIGEFGNDITRSYEGVKAKDKNLTVFKGTDGTISVVDNDRPKKPILRSKNKKDVLKFIKDIKLPTKD